MVIASLAWSIKAWAALLLPVSRRWRERHQAEQDRMLRMDFRGFVQTFILVPAQILVHGRQLILRLLAWRPTLPTFFRLLDARASTPKTRVSPTATASMSNRICAPMG